MHISHRSHSVKAQRWSSCISGLKFYDYIYIYLPVCLLDTNSELFGL